MVNSREVKIPPAFKKEVLKTKSFWMRADDCRIEVDDWVFLESHWGKAFACVRISKIIRHKETGRFKLLFDKICLRTGKRKHPKTTAK